MQVVCAREGDPRKYQQEGGGARRQAIRRRHGHGCVAVQVAIRSRHGHGCVAVQVAIVGLSPTGDPETQWRTCLVIVLTPQRARAFGAFTHQFPTWQRAAEEASAC